MACARRTETILIVGENGVSVFGQAPAGKANLQKSDAELAAEFGVTSASTTPSAGEPPVPAVAVVKSFYDALNRGEVEAAMALVADDARFAEPFSDSASGTMAIRQLIQKWVSERYRFELKGLRPGRSCARYCHRVLAALGRSDPMLLG